VETKDSKGTLIFADSTGMTRIPLVTMLGFVLCVTGEILRKLAMFTAMENFTHVIRDEKVEGHKLISHGVFRLCRHPSYAGWFWWSIGTQVGQSQLINIF